MPTKCLEELVWDLSSEVRIAIVDNPSTPTVILQQLIHDNDPNVRYAIAENANMPTYLLRVLLNDSHPYVAIRAAKTLDRLFKAAQIYNNLIEWPCCLLSSDTLAQVS